MADSNQPRWCTHARPTDRHALPHSSDSKETGRQRQPTRGVRGVIAGRADCAGGGQENGLN